jgi:arabinofuranosyltransferase
LAFSPFLTWEGFSLVYYGFLVPNTAYAKLKTGIPFFELLHQGLSYFSDSLQNDPLTLITIVCALSVSLYDKKLRPVAFGLVFIRRLSASYWRRFYEWTLF